MKNAAKRKTQSDVAGVRAKLRVPLNDLFDETEHSDENTETSSASQQRKEERAKHRGRPIKKPKEVVLPSTSAMSQRNLKEQTRKRPAGSESEEAGSEPTPTVGKQPESRIFKLFDKRVDMSKFSENTPLYAICRAWFQNKPEDPNMINFRTRKQVVPKKRTLDGAELWNKVRRNEITEVLELPRPCATNIPPMPPPLPAKNPQTKARIDAVMRACAKNPVTEEKLMEEHRERWKSVRQHWLAHTIKYRQARFKYSYLILQHLQKRNKEQQLMQQM